MKALREVLDGPFAEWLGEDDWTPWFAFLSALRAEPMSRRERAIYRQCTGRQQLPQQPFNEAWIVAGRRARKSAIAAVLGCYAAVYGRWVRAAGETVRVLVVAVSKDQAKLIRNYCEAILESRPGLKRLIKATDTESITLTNGIQIICASNSYRSIRGPTVVCAIFEELAFWYSDDSANPDKEVLRAVRPSMLTVPGALLLGISSPYAKRGLLYEKYREHYGRDDSRVLVWKASTETMNPQVDADTIAQAYADDPVAAAAEYGGEFRSDLESFISREAVDAVVSRGLFERPRMRGVRYFGFCDPSGGARDSFTAAIAHADGDTAVLDAVRERKSPFSPEAVVGEFAAFFQAYGITSIRGDRYSGEFVHELFRKKSVTYRTAKKTKSDLYLGLLPRINSGLVDLLDHAPTLNQLVRLERRTARGGKDSVDHPPNASDDLINAAAGALSYAVAGPAVSLGSSFGDMPLGLGAQLFVEGRRRSGHMPVGTTHWIGGQV
jgi:hypothetical protein